MINIYRNDVITQSHTYRCLVACENPEDADEIIKEHVQSQLYKPNNWRKCKLKHSETKPRFIGEYIFNNY